MTKSLLMTMVLALALVACARETNETAAGESTSGMSPGMGMGPGSGMMERHHAPIPGEYAGLANPIAADDDSLARGAETYNTQCASCHGDGGMGDGPAAAGLDPSPAAVAHTSQMMGDDYLFYRISEGGAFAPFNSAMPSWKSVLDESARWDVINYVRALGSGQIMPGQRMGGSMFDPEAEALRHAEMARKGVEEGLITQGEADTFLAVHTELDALMREEIDRSGGMDDMQAVMLGQLVERDRITQQQADIFSQVHDVLLEAGLME